ncbi:MAG: carboxymuconolactone decarboxylase family protein [Chloroflexi bacterium]|nr:carboxymuconolactone decarboxylase family protein [Chloroflexota bacterium]
MALTRFVAEEEATGKVKEIYDDIKRSRGLAQVPNFWKALAVNPDYLEVTWNRIKVIMRPGKLDTLTKEIIALSVSATNNCDYCIRSHMDACRALGLDEEGILEVMAVVDFFNGSNSIASGLKIEYEPPVRVE